MNNIFFLYPLKSNVLNSCKYLFFKLLNYLNMKKIYKLLSIFLFAILLANGIFAQFSTDSIDFWIGEGENQAVLIVDFNDSTTTECYAWGYRFNGIKTGEQMLTDIALADMDFTIDITGGFLNSITYNGHEGLPGSPDYWMTFSGTSLSDWTMNNGISTELANNDWFGCSYTGVDSIWNPLFVPENPVSASTMGIAVIANSFNFTMFPNPANNFVTLEFENPTKAKIEIANIYGQIVYSQNISQSKSTLRIDISKFKRGAYTLQITDNKAVSCSKFIKL